MPASADILACFLRELLPPQLIGECLQRHSEKEIYILQAGVAADSSIEGQLGFHLDFLKAARNFNSKFRKAFSKQLALVSSNC